MPPSGVTHHTHARATRPACRDGANKRCLAESPCLDLLLLRHSLHRIEVHLDQHLGSRQAWSVVDDDLHAATGLQCVADKLSAWPLANRRQREGSREITGAPPLRAQTPVGDGGATLLGTVTTSDWVATAPPWKFSARARITYRRVWGVVMIAGVSE